MPQTKATQRECPFCKDTVDSRGLYAHVMHSEGDGHGERGSVPDGFNPREAPIVTEDDVVIEADLEEEYPNRLMLCHHCGTICKDRRGLAIHLSKSAGDELHPPDASISDGSYTVIPADEDWNPLVDQSELSQLHDEITADLHEIEHYQPEGMSSDALMSDAELQELIDQAVIPRGESKVEQVAALLNQVPELYDRPEAVKEVINCSTTTFYEGRKMFDNNAVPEIEEPPTGERVDAVEQPVWEHHEGQAVVIDGETLLSNPCGNTTKGRPSSLTVSRTSRSPSTDPSSRISIGK